MSQLQERISQFRKWATENPDDDLAHFRLGQLLMESNELPDAMESFRRTLELMPTFSKAYQLLGACQMKAQQNAEAVETLTKGWHNAEERGDRIPKQAMEEMLRELGAPVPQAVVAEREGGEESGFKCQRPGCMSGKYAKQMDKPPIPDEIGLRIHQEICSDCWTEWLKNYSIKVINELRIDLSTEGGMEEYDKYMRGFFGFEETTVG
jgi:Fe-S cluster biosynthesis and repair protein YggX